MQRRAKILGLGIVVKSRDKFSKQVSRLSKYAKHPRTEMTSLVERLMEAGEYELDRLDQALHSYLTETSTSDNFSSDSQTGTVLRHTSMKKALSVGCVIGFEDVKTGQKLTGKIILDSLSSDPKQQIFLIKVLKDTEHEGTFYICMNDGENFIGNDEF